MTGVATNTAIGALINATTGAMINATTGAMMASATTDVLTSATTGAMTSATYVPFCHHAIKIAAGTMKIAHCHDAATLTHNHESLLTKLAVVTTGTHEIMMVATTHAVLARQDRHMIGGSRDEKKWLKVFTVGNLNSVNCEQMTSHDSPQMCVVQIWGHDFFHFSGNAFPARKQASS